MQNGGLYFYFFIFLILFSRGDDTMIDYINYYYDLYPNSINNIDDKYMFYIDSEKYYFIIYDRNIEELNELLELNKEMIKNGSLVSEIIFNKFDEVLNNYNGKLYILLRVYINDTKLVSIDDVIFMLNEPNINFNKDNIKRVDWVKLWESKIDYFEYQMGHLIKKYPILYNIIDYYLGISENAVSYLKNVTSVYSGNVSLGVCHKRIGVNSTLFDLYNPINLIIDYKVRDIAEYLKDSFINESEFENNLIKVHTNYYFDKLNLSLLVSRFLFPSYFFDKFEDIVYNNNTESSINNIIKKSSCYEDFLNKYIKECNLQSIGWLDKS